METPDKWVVIQIGTEKPLYKVFASWYGGYLGSDSWKMNSGIKSLEDEKLHIDFHGYSGSCYRCIKGTYGTNSYTQSVLNNIIDMATKINTIITILPENTDWSKLLNE